MNQLFYWTGIVFYCLLGIGASYFLILFLVALMQSIYKDSWLAQTVSVIKIWNRYVRKGKEVGASVVDLKKLKFSFEVGKNKNHIWKRYCVRFITNQIIKKYEDELARSNNPDERKRIQVVRSTKA